MRFLHDVMSSQIGSVQEGSTKKHLGNLHLFAKWNTAVVSGIGIKGMPIAENGVAERDSGGV